MIDQVELLAKGPTGHCKGNEAIVVVNHSLISKQDDRKAATGFAKE